PTGDRRRRARAPHRDVLARRLRRHDVRRVRPSRRRRRARVRPAVSVVLPTYNRAHLLEPSVESVRAQTGVDFEIIVVDDGSTDDTLARLARIDDPRLRVVTIAHGGVAAARNAGVAAARGDVVAFHDSDDVALPGRLARPAAVLHDRPELGLVIQNGEFLPPEDAPEAG